MLRSRYSRRAPKYVASISAARHTGGPTPTTNAYANETTTVAMAATAGSTRNWRSVQKMANARMLRFIPETTST